MEWQSGQWVFREDPHLSFISRGTLEQLCVDFAKK